MAPIGRRCRTASVMPAEGDAASKARNNESDSPARELPGPVIELVTTQWSASVRHRLPGVLIVISVRLARVGGRSRERTTAGADLSNDQQNVWLVQ